MFPFAYPSPTTSNANWAKVALLLQFDGTNGQTTTVDDSGFAHTITLGSGAALSTAQKVFGTAALLLDGSNDFCNCGNHPAEYDTASNTTPFTMEGFFRFVSIAGDQTLWGNWDPPGGGWLLRMTAGSLDWNNFAGTNFSFATWNPVINTWYYVCMEFNGTKMRLYTGVPGGSTTMVASNTNTQQLANLGAGASIGIGVQSGTNTGRFFNGYIDEVRLVNGLAVYDTDAGYSVPASAFPIGSI